MAVRMNMAEIHQNSNEPIPHRGVSTAALLLWMLGLMLLGWFLLDGPGISSIVKRVASFKRAQCTLRSAMGEPAVPTALPDGESQP